MKLIPIIVLILLSACSTPKDKYPDKDVCIILYDLKREKYEYVFNEKRCHERKPASSTFKIPLSVLAYEHGILKDENLPVFHPPKNILAIWNNQQTPASWMKESVLWVSQHVAEKIGMEKLLDGLNLFSYGNQDMTGGLKYAWRTPAPFISEAFQNTLKISAFEQVKFIRSFVREELPASKASQIATKKILDQDNLGNKVLTGKTAPGFIDSKYSLRMGWYVGYLSAKDPEHIIVVNFDDTKSQGKIGYGGKTAKEIAIMFLTDRNLL